MSALTYKGFASTVEFDAEDEVFFGRIVGINDVVGFHATDATTLKAAFREAVDDYEATCRSVGKTPEKPYSGKMMFRVDPKVHANAALAAHLSGKSLNQWAEEQLRQAAEREVGQLTPA
jgi:predicted HicB family RNase H-like nuclease